MEGKKGDFSRLNKILLAFGVVLLILFVFGMTCVISKFVLFNQTERTGVFGKTVANVEQSFAESEFNGASRVVVTLDDINNIKIGAYVVVDGETTLSAVNVGVLDSFNDESVTLIMNDESVSLDKDYIIGFVSSTSSAECGAIDFFSGVWTLVIFVILPAVLLIAIISIWAWSRLVGREINGNEGEISKDCDEKENANNELDEENTTKKNSKAKKEKKEKAPKPKLPPKAKNESVIGNREQMFFDFEKIEESAEEVKDIERTKKNKQSSKIKRKDDNHLLVEKKQVTKKETKAKKPMQVIDKPRAKRQGDDYVFRTDPPMDTNTPIKEMLDKITNTKDDETDEVQNLLDKMKKQ